MPVALEQLMKQDRRAEWKELKKKHEKLISKAKVDFNKSFGPSLDKYQTQVEAFKTLASTVELASMHTQGILDAGKAVEKTAASYKDLVKKLDEPAKKELTTFLTAIEADIHSWMQVTMDLVNMPVKITAVHKKAVGGVVIYLPPIVNMCSTIITRGPRAVDAYKKANRPAAAICLSQLVEAARLAGSAAFQLQHAAGLVLEESNYNLFKSRGKVACTLIQNALHAAEVFSKNWDTEGSDSTACDDADAKTIKNNFVQISADFGPAVKGLNALPWSARP